MESLRLLCRGVCRQARAWSKSRCARPGRARKLHHLERWFRRRVASVSPTSFATRPNFSPPALRSLLCGSTSHRAPACLQQRCSRRPLPPLERFPLLPLWHAGAGQRKGGAGEAEASRGNAGRAARARGRQTRKRADGLAELCTPRLTGESEFHTHASGSDPVPRVTRIPPAAAGDNHPRGFPPQPWGGPCAPDRPRWHARCFVLALTYHGIGMGRDAAMQCIPASNGCQ